MKQNGGRVNCMGKWAACCFIGLLSGSRILGSELVTEPTRTYIVGYTLEDLQDPPMTFTQIVTDSTIISLTEVRVGLHLVGDPVGQGWAGDMYVSLNRSLTATAILLNGVGISEFDPAGYGYDGWNVEFWDDAPYGDVHVINPIGSILGGQVAPDGRMLAESLDRPAMLSVFVGRAGNGLWNLSVADLGSGGRMRLESWSLTLTGTTEIPEAVLPMWMWGLLPGLMLWRWYRSRPGE
jgi:hypothetical protein